MHPNVLAIYSILEFKKGNKSKAVEYYIRAQTNGFNNNRLGMIGDEKIKKEAVEILGEIEKISES